MYGLEEKFFLKRKTILFNILQNQVNILEEFYERKLHEGVRLASLIPRFKPNLEYTEMTQKGRIAQFNQEIYLFKSKLLRV